MTALTTLDFHGAKLIAIAGDRPETAKIALKPIVEGMRLDWEGQRQKIERHPVLATCTSVIKVQLPGDTQEREHTFLSLNRLNFWLATIPPGRIKDDAVRAAVITYQTELADVAFNHFFGRAFERQPEPVVGSVADMDYSELNAKVGFSRQAYRNFGKLGGAWAWNAAGLPTPPREILTPAMRIVMGLDPFTEAPSDEARPDQMILRLTIA